MARRSTRDEIVAVAMRMFVDRGYDATSLREIADEIGVTKAALYYHFRTKEDIVRAALEAHGKRIDALLDWLAGTDPGADRDAALVDRLTEIFSGESSLAMRFGQVNQTVLARQDFGTAHLQQIKRLVELVSGRSGPEAEIRATLAFGALVMGNLGGGPEAAMVLSGTDRQRRAAARRVALDQLAGIRAVQQA